MDNLVLISAQPHDIYFAWQLEVQIVNFRKFGLSDKMQVLVWYPDTEAQKLQGESPEPLNKDMWRKLREKYPEVKFFFYKDSVLNISLYIPVLRPRILAMHFEVHPELKDKVIFYHDSDIIFNYLPDFQKLCKGSINWQSNTSSYLDYDYLSRKEKEGNIPQDEATQKLCEIGGIELDTLKSYTGKTGGAQCILKGIDADFWKDVEMQVLDIRKAFKHGVPDSINTKYFQSEAAGFQSWCADMWALNMALWSRGKVTDVTGELDFSWATDSEETYLRKPIYHNAGATGTQPGIFHKGAWMHKSPLGRIHAVKKATASWHYVQAIAEVK